MSYSHYCIMVTTAAVYKPMTLHPCSKVLLSVIDLKNVILDCRNVIDPRVSTLDKYN